VAPIFPIDKIGLLHAADIDGDGLKDLVLVNNSFEDQPAYNQTDRRIPDRKPLTKRE
jgi:hypothetical protein